MSLTVTDAADQVHFDLADFPMAVRLTRRLERTRSTMLLFEENELYVVVAAFRPGSNDLAVLLREVEAWVAEESLCAIRYMLDDRIYVLESGGPDWTSHPWGVPDEEASQETTAA
jgi:hypothetical protein